MGCNAYQLASYYEDSDGIYVSNEEVLITKLCLVTYADETLNSYSSTDNKSQYLPWGANPETTEVVNNFFPSFGSYYLIHLLQHGIQSIFWL